MLDNLGFKTRELQKRRKAYADRLKANRTPLHLIMTKAEILLSPGGISSTPPSVLVCKVLLNDMTPFGLFLYSSEPLKPGQMVQLTVNEPKQFFAQGYVSSCENTTLGHRVISKNSFIYRIQIRFEFHSAADQLTVRSYCDEILVSYLRKDLPY